MHLPFLSNPAFCAFPGPNLLCFPVLGWHDFIDGQGGPTADLMLQLPESQETVIRLVWGMQVESAIVTGDLQIKLTAPFVSSICKTENIQQWF